MPSHTTSDGTHDDLVPNVTPTAAGPRGEAVRGPLSGKSNLLLHGWENRRPPGHWQHWLAGELAVADAQVLYPQQPERSALGRGPQSSSPWTLEGSRVEASAAGHLPPGR